jgi:hypothetical protein
LIITKSTKKNLSYSARSVCWLKPCARIRRAHGDHAYTIPDFANRHNSYELGVWLMEDFAG